MSLARRSLSLALTTLLALAAAPAALAHADSGLPTLSSTPEPTVASPVKQPAAGEVRGTVVSLDWSELTVQSPVGQTSVIGALTYAANTVAGGDYPYVWGGGHAFAGTPSTGMRGGPGYNGRRIGFDCSGSVAAVLAGAGLWTAGTGVPSDAGVIATLRHENLIARGAGSGPGAVTLWDDPGVHIFIEIGTRFFGTSDGGAPSPENPNGGPGWLDDGAPDTLQHVFHPWHLVPAALSGSVSVGPTLTVGLGGAVADTAADLEVGDRVGVRYAIHHRALVAVAVDPLAGDANPVQ